MKPKNSRFSGMKTHPYVNTAKNAIKENTRKKKQANSSISKKKGLSAYQLRTQEEFMKVREGETREQWVMRTRFRRIRTEEEIALTNAGRKRLEKKDLRRKNSKKKKVLQLKTLNKDFDFLKYYVFIINWAVAKFNISQLDLEIGFHFYENVHFTKDQFLNKCKLCVKANDNTFKRFIDNGYMYENQTSIEDGINKRKTGLFRLTGRFVGVLTAVYEKIAFQSEFNFKPTYTRTIPLELEKVIIQMAEENKAIVTGKKEPQNMLIFNNQNYEQSKES